MQYAVAGVKRDEVDPVYLDREQPSTVDAFQPQREMASFGVGGSSKEPKEIKI